MQITRKSDYAIRCVLFLSGRGPNSSTVGDIASACGITRAFAAKVLQDLVKAGIVASTRGLKGGFVMAKEPTEVSIMDVIQAIEGGISLNICVVDSGNCERSGTCPVHPVWTEIQQDMVQKLSEYTFDRLLSAPAGAAANHN